MAKAKTDWTARFVRANEAPKPRLIGLSIGEVGTAKTSFWLSAPGPIAVFSFDQGLEGVIERFQDDKEIYVKEYEWMPTEDTSQEDAITLRDDFIADFEQAIQNARTVVIDKETQLWQLFRYADFGGPSENPKNYAALNQRYRRFLNMPKATDINFGIIESMKDQWASVKKHDGTGSKGVQTGLRVRQGFEEADELVHLTLHHIRENGEFRYTVGKSRGPGSRDVQDQTFTISEPETAFTELAVQIFPDSKEEDWS